MTSYCLGHKDATEKIICDLYKYIVYLYEVTDSTDGTEYTSVFKWL